MSTALNWKEIERLAHFLDSELKGAELLQIAIPAKAKTQEESESKPPPRGKPSKPKDTVRFEWLYRFGSKRDSSYVFLSLQPQNPTLAFFEEKPWPLVDGASRSPFELRLLQELEGLVIQKIRAVEGDRILLLEFGPRGAGDVQFVVAWFLIPARPDAYLLKPTPRPDSFELIAQFRDPNTQETKLKLPAQPPKDFEVRESIRESLAAWSAFVREGRDSKGVTQKKTQIERVLNERLKKLKKSLEQTESALAQGSKETGFQQQGDLLKSLLHTKPKLVKVGKAYVYELPHKDGTVTIPGDARLSASEQVQKLYEKAKKSETQKKELSQRALNFAAGLKAAEALLNELNAIDLMAGHAHAQLGALEAKLKTAASSTEETASTLGKSFISKDGLSIRVGRNSAENLELTLHYARGNDLWLHVRGGPGSHVIVRLDKGKSAPLETLLDAATLAVYYTKGKDADKTEVDYTFKKHVRSIKGQKEVTYSQNKTVLVDLDPKRLQRLLSQ